MRNDDWYQVHDLVVVSASTVFRSAGIAAAYTGTVPYRQAPWADTVAIIGLGGQKLRGSLVLSVPTALLLESHPNKGTERRDLLDWLGELSNLLLGRIKNTLLSYDVAVELSSPVTLSASDLRLEFAAPPIVYEFASGTDNIDVVFETVAAPGVRLEPQSSKEILAPGGMVTF